MNKLLIIDALCYSLDQVLTSYVSINITVDGPASALKQAKELANEVKVLAKDVYPELLKALNWYSALQIDAVISANDFADCFLVDLDELGIEALECVADEDDDDSWYGNGNMPCDTYGMEACSSSCPNWFDCNK